MRPFDPYRALQLHPAAPRDLIEGAYWLLVSARSPAPGDSRREELHAAYAALAGAEARRSHGAGGAAVRTRGPLLRLFSARTQTADAHDEDYYRLLRIDSEADIRIIQLAHDFWTRSLRRGERERIEEAYRTLANPLLRAQYDARRAEAAARPEVELTRRPREPMRFERHDEADAQPRTAAAGTLSGRVLLEAQQNRLLQLRDDAALPAPPAGPEQHRAAALAFIAGPRTGERMDLAGASVSLGSGEGCALVLHDASMHIEPEHARLAPHGASYVFHDLAGHDTTIADRPLSVPVVILEDGDEIQIGVHRLRFTQRMPATARPELHAGSERRTN